MRQWIFSFVFFFSSSTQAGWLVGNGGDTLRLVVSQAKPKAAEMVMAMHPGVEMSALVAEFLTQHQTALAADILASSHLWHFEAKPTCAWTTRLRESQIEFSLPSCRESLHQFRDVLALIIHESVHHFGIEEEAFADEVALTIVNANHSGATHWSTLATLKDKDSRRWHHSAVWSGKEMIIFGGILENDNSTSSGWRYHPSRESWTKISAEGAPSRFGHDAIYLNEKMIVWGGSSRENSGNEVHKDGFVYNVEKDSWSKLPKLPGELYRASPSRFIRTQRAVATSHGLVVWGGLDSDGTGVGGVLNGNWKKLANIGAPLRSGGHSLVSTGDTVIVWGGLDAQGQRTNAGASFDLKTERWHALSLENAPPATERHQAIWTGRYMLVFGGLGANSYVSGTLGRYDPKNDSWQTIILENAPSREGHSLMWNGSELFIWGGKTTRTRTYFQGVTTFNPVTKEVRVIAGQITPRYFQSNVWTGSQWLIFGGMSHSNDVLGDGAIFIP